MKRTCAVTILAQNAKQGTLLSHSKQVACDKVLGQNSCQPVGLQPESALDCVARLAKVLDIPCDERLAITNSGSNAHVFMLLCTLQLTVLFRTRARYAAGAC